MEKAILVIDMPSCCEECSLMFEDEYSYWCPVRCEESKKDLYSKYIVNHTKPGWCPLRKAPEHMSSFFEESDYMSGYNDCLNEILGE